MGGNVFKEKYESVRLDRKDYDLIIRGFYEDFHYFLSQNEYDWHVIPAYREKESFGDMDVIYCNLEARDKMVEFLKRLGIPEDKISTNSNVVSFLYNRFGLGDFQIDLIYMHSAFYQSALDYYAYNDLGNLRGRIAHLLGLKLGHEGLSYIHKEGDRVCFEITLSRDLETIDKFLGFKNVEKFYAIGPKNLEEIFEYVASSDYFNPDIYLLHNRNHQSRIRDKKRKTYTEFLKWCEQLPKDREYFPRPENKGWYQLNAINHFGKKNQLINNLIMAKKQSIIKSKFNGSIVMELTGLTGVELGKFMTNFRSCVSDTILEFARSDAVKLLILDFYWKERNES